MKKSIQELYAERVKRLEDASACKVPDRVPVLVGVGYFGAKYTGMTKEDVWNNPEKTLAATKKVVVDMEPDIYQGYALFSSKIFDVFDTKTFKRPGKGIDANSSHQAVEGEFMKADEYDAFMKDPSDFIFRTFLPRTSGLLAPFQKLPPLTLFSAFSAPMQSPVALFTHPVLVDIFKKLYEAGLEAQKLTAMAAAAAKELDDLGFPTTVRFGGGGTMPPFDMISDKYRGMKGTMLDMYRQPDKLIELIEMLMAYSVQSLKAASAQMKPMPGKCKLTYMATHRSSDGFMSLKQYEKFVWPYLKQIINLVVDAGFTPMILWEGDYTTRLEYFLELPKGKVVHCLDRTDVFKAKEILGGHACIAGGLPISLLQVGSVQDVEDLCKKLIKVVGKDGGYIMSSTTGLDDSKPENVKAMVDCAKKYGVYK